MRSKESLGRNYQDFKKDRTQEPRQLEDTSVKQEKEMQWLLPA